MALYKTLLVLGLATVSPFSIAQQIVLPGNNKAPYQPPYWFVRMAAPERQFPAPIDGFIVGSGEPSRVVPKNSGIKYACQRLTEQGEKKWQFCDM